MDRLDRILSLHKILAGRHVPVPFGKIMSELECSRATAKRAIRTLRDDLGAPLEYDRERNGYIYAASNRVWQLPGLWLNQSELIALVTSEKLLAEVEPGVLKPILAPLRERLVKLLEQRQLGAGGLLNRVRIFQTETRAIDLTTFRKIADALGSRRQLNVLYHGRQRDETSERTLSPQRLIYYRDNWYLDAWCHASNGLRTFSVDRLYAIETVDAPAREIDDAELDAHFKSGYGIFAGKATDTAVLHFSPEQSNWVADEQWHPGQQGKVLADGSYELRVPYADPRELIMQIMKYGPEVEVIAPAKLRREVAERAKRAAAIYTKSRMSG